jgi:CheY-like chemotaxis protein
MLFEQSGFLVVTGLTYEIRDGRMNLEAFIRQHRPDVIVYDIAPPYDRNWALFQHLRAAEAIRTIPVVLTTTNEQSVRAFVSDVPEIHELVGKPYDLDQILQAVRAATGKQIEDRRP